ncbi:MAG TPA: TPM domain-containing protein [Ohtaekwangia sp.]
MRYLLTSGLLIIFFATTGQSTIESVPNQKLINGSYVSNPDKILSEGTVTQIDTLLKFIERRTTAQIAVVVLESIGNEDIVDFAQKLFMKWGVGQGNDNGLLLLLVKNQRTVRFHTGYGLEGVLPDIICKRIQREFMVPEFKNGNYNAGILAGLQQVEKILTDPKYAEEIKAEESNEVSDWVGFVTFLCIFIAPVVLIIYFIKARQRRFADSQKPEQTPYPEMRLKRWTWVIMFAGIPLGIVLLLGFSDIENPAGLCFFLLYLYFMFTLFHRLWRVKRVLNRFLQHEEYYESVEFIRKGQWYWLAIAFVFPFPFIFYFFYHLARKRIYRNHPRSCKQCRCAMHKLSERTEDEFLSKEQQMEETLKAVDYDVWKCEACQAIEMCFYLNRHSRYQPCPKCKTIAYHFVGKRTLESATYSSSGKGEETHTCQYCGYTKKSTYTISRLTRSTSSSSSSSSGSSGSSASSSGSWGGGRSGGGGASSSW